MKKVLMVIFASLMAVCLLSACGENSSQEAVAPSEAVSEVTTNEEAATEETLSMYDEARQQFSDVAGISLPDTELTEEAFIFHPYDDGKSFHFQMNGTEAKKLYEDTITSFTEQLGEPTQIINEEPKHFYRWSSFKDDGGSISYYVTYEEPNGTPFVSIDYENSDSAPADGAIWQS